MYFIYIDGIVQERCYSIANALELCLSCINPSTCVMCSYLFANFTVHECMAIQNISLSWDFPKRRQNVSRMSNTQIQCATMVPLIVLKGLITAASFILAPWVQCYHCGFDLTVASLTSLAWVWFYYCHFDFIALSFFLNKSPDSKIKLMAVTLNSRQWTQTCSSKVKLMVINYYITCYSKIKVPAVKWQSRNSMQYNKTRCGKIILPGTCGLRYECHSRGHIDIKMLSYKYKNF